MLRQRARLITVTVFLLDLGLTTVAFYVAYAIREQFFSQSFGPLAPLPEVQWLLALILPTWSVLLYWMELYETQRTRSFWAGAWRITKAVAFGTLIVGAIVFVSKTAAEISRLFIVLFAANNLLLLMVRLIAMRFAAHYIRTRGYNYRNILVVGTGRSAREIARQIEAHRHWGLLVAGFIAHDHEPSPEVDQKEILGTLADLPHLLTHAVIDEVIFTVTSQQVATLEESLLLCEEHGVPTRIALDFFPHFIAKAHLDELQGIPLLTFSPAPHNELLLAIKRAFDLGVSALALIVLAPVILVIAAAITITSPGPVLFRQTRIGLHGRRFTLYKFRSMVPDAEARRAALESFNELRGPVFKMRDDPRITPVGWFLRRTSLDELPQLMNVLKGDMSLVGPRPPVPEEVAQYQQWQRRRLSMKPGLTGLWQVSGRSEIKDFNARLALDLQYIDNWSLTLDLQICVKTIPIVLLGRGAS